MDELRDEDGTRLLFYEDVAAMTNNLVSTIRAYNSSAKRKRRNRTNTVYDFPAPRKKVQRTTVKANGAPVTAWTPVWREDRIEEWQSRKRGPGGHQVRPSPGGEAIGGGAADGIAALE
jgi:hypothetical protein